MSKAPQRLTKLRIREVSSVDRGAGEGVRVLLMKALELSPDYTATGALPADAEAYVKRDFTDAERKTMSSTGQAMPGGGFPIKSTADLANAIQAIGRAKDPTAAKKHIIARARALGASDKVPPEWTQTQPTKKQLEDDVVRITLAALAAGAVRSDVRKAFNAIKASLDSMEEAGSPETNITKSFDEFVVHLRDLVHNETFDRVCDGITKSYTDERRDPMADAKTEPKTLPEALTIIKSQGDAVAKLADQVAWLSLPEANRAYAVKKAMSADDKKKWAGMTQDQRDAAMKDDEATEAKKGDQITKGEVNTEIAKRDERIAKLEQTNKSMVDERDLNVAKADAKGMGLGEDFGEVLMKSRRGDTEAFKKVEERMRALAKQANPALFTELGKAGGNAGATAADQMKVKADEYLKALPADKKCSPEQAFDKVYNDPVNKDLREQCKAEEFGKMRAA